MYLLLYYCCGCVYTASGGTHVEARGPLCGVGSLFQPLCGFWGHKLGCKRLYPENHLAARITHFYVYSDIHLEKHNEYTRSLAFHKNLVSLAGLG